MASKSFIEPGHLIENANADVPSRHPSPLARDYARARRGNIIIWSLDGVMDFGYHGEIAFAISQKWCPEIGD